MDEGLTVFDFPRSWWRRIRTINGLERLHREIRRRTRVVGIFPHEASALRLISAVLAEIHEEWLTGRQYLNLAGWKKQVEQSFPKGPKGNYRKTVAQPGTIPPGSLLMLQLRHFLQKTIPRSYLNLLVPLMCCERPLSFASKKCPPYLMSQPKKKCAISSSN